MVVNATPQYRKAEFQYIIAKLTEDKIKALKLMMELAPKHKGSEKMLADLKKRLARLKDELIREKEVRKRKGHALSVRKEGDAQVVMIGFTNSGKSSLLARLTNAHPKIADYPFTTAIPEIGTLDLDCKIQVVDTPAITISSADKEILSIAGNADLILMIVTSPKELTELMAVAKDNGIQNKKLFVINKSELLAPKDRNDIIRNIGVKNALFISTSTGNGIQELKQKIFSSLEIIRVYTKQPGKKQTEEPLVIPEKSTIRDAADKIRKDYVPRFMFARVWGPSARFPGQKVGILHELKDKDIIELHLK